MNIIGSGLKAGLIGAKLGHSLSPQIHRLLGDYEYRLYELEEGDIPGFLDKMRSGSGPSAINVTIPYKQTVMPYLDGISKTASSVGAVNTVVARSGRLYGYVTDPVGFSCMLDRAGIEISGRKCLCLGDGGAAKSVLEVLRAREAGGVTVISRRSETDNYDNISRHYDAEVIVNCTPVGMYPKNGDELFELGNFHRLEACADLIYNPAVTAFLRDADRCGAKTVNGLTMLTAQALRSRDIFLGITDDDIRPFSTGEMSEIADVTSAVRRDMLSVGLVGMPGSGKTSVGRRLSELTGRELIDTDAMIEEKAGMSIPEIFSRFGEERFRDIESECVAEASKLGGKIISYGGGAVLREKNRMLIKQNSAVFWLERPPHLLSREGRPLSGGKSDDEMREMYNKRCAAYECASDARIICSGGEETIDSAAKRIMRMTGIPEI